MRQVILAVVLFSTFASAQASLISMSGDFSATTAASTGVTSISGTWAGQFDDSVVTGIGVEGFSVAPAAISLSPNPIGATLFNASNVELEYFLVQETSFKWAWAALLVVVP